MTLYSGFCLSYQRRTSLIYSVPVGSMTSNCINSKCLPACACGSDDTHCSLLSGRQSMFTSTYSGTSRCKTTGRGFEGSSRQPYVHAFIVHPSSSPWIAASAGEEYRTVGTPGRGWFPFKCLRSGNRFWPALDQLLFHRDLIHRFLPPSS